MNIHSLIQLLVVLEECRKPEAVVDEIKHVILSYGFSFFGLLRRIKEGEDPNGRILAGHWPDSWPQIYLAKKYILSDPTIRYLAYTQRPFRWKEGLAAFRKDPNFRRMDMMMTDAASHGLKDGYTFPIHGRTGVLGNMMVGGKRPVDLSPVEISLFDAVARKGFWRILELNGRAQALESSAEAEARLTRRETEILRYLAEGMTSVEIGKSLKISNHTVDWYVNGLQDKLKAKNRQHAVAVAFRHGLIT
ncbi:LuxR family transcriptional regulator [Rhizobium grahamii]|uniref:LuxR family transcriptional regulator n=1 Tax=Rhizobium grahamii TaxID=1120045 RepID=A0A5Q0C733_9HYPH|nr:MULTISPECIES: LuxR family transcriptional regulator [Rhizobium]QFY61758.1 LuxR family transcriptional regulator [Rhizobium grahamii]QRM49077.1 LuxR family transcriptional regulator [Rhizobium sp. BG6]